MPSVPAKDLAKTTSLVNGYISDFVAKNCEYPPLGPAYTKEFDSDTVEKWLATYRIRKYFQVPSGNTNTIEKSIDAMLTYDRECSVTAFDPGSDKHLPNSVRKILYTARLELHRILRKYKYSPAKHMKMPSGEGLIPAKGDTSVFAKLTNQEYWCCTADAFDLVAETIYKTRWLKRIAKGFIGNVPRDAQKLLALAFDCNGFEIFKSLLLDVITIVDGCAISYVDKDNDAKRVITREPLLNMICQLVVSGGVKHCLRKGWSYDKETAQGVHGNMISDLNYATFDLSNASNSNWLPVVEWFLPSNLFGHLLNTRSPVGTWKGQSHEFAMLAPMGNGFTFEIMTVILMAVAKSCDYQSSVYGDDIIIKKTFSDVFLATLSYMGYQVNTSKSFNSGYFRESCGAFFHKERYLRSYKVEYATDAFDAVINVNKLIILRDILGINDSLRELIKTLPLALLKEGDLASVENPDLSGVISVPSSLLNVKRLKKKCKDWTRNIPTYKHQMAEAIRDYTYDHRKVDFYINLDRVSLTYIQTKRWRKPPVDDVRQLAVIGYYLYSGMCTAPAYRNKTRLTGRLVVY